MRPLSVLPHGCRSHARGLKRPLRSAGKYVQQTPKARVDSLEYWMEGERNIRKTDIVTWISFGTPSAGAREGFPPLGGLTLVCVCPTGVTHLVRPEDWPVMP